MRKIKVVDKRTGKQVKAEVRVGRNGELEMRERITLTTYRAAWITINPNDYIVYREPER